MHTLSDLLARPEGRTLDFKRQEVTVRNVLKTLVSFANTAGGTLILGVDDDGTAIGVNDVKVEEERFANAISSGIEPPLVPDLVPVEQDGQDLLLIRVPRFPGPFYLREDGPDDGIYVRVGSTSRRARPEQREEMRRMAGLQAYDERPCHGASVEDLDLDAVDRSFSRVGRIVDGSFLETLKLVVRFGDAKVPSNGGIILFGTAEARARYFPEARLRCARFVGPTKADFLDQLDTEGSLVDALAEAERFVRRNSRLPARIEGLRREDVPEYSPVILREVLANAVAHADYSIRGMAVRVAVFSDRLTVENPGGWPISISEADFKEGVSHIRNPVIARVLHELDIIERWGSGYRRIQKEAELGGYPLPTWKETGPVLRVALPSHPGVYPVTDDDSVDDRVPTEPGTLNERQRWMLVELAQGNDTNAETLVTHFGVSESTARRDISALRKRRLVAFEGAPKIGRYVLLRGGADSDAPL